MEKKVKRFLKTSNIPVGITVTRKSAVDLLCIIIMVRTAQLGALLTDMYSALYPTRDRNPEIQFQLS